MLRRQVSVLLAFLLVAGGLAFGLVHLFQLRLLDSDVYPAYSTLRTDPLGTRALYEALDQMPALETARNFQPLPKLHPERPITLFYLALPHTAIWERDELAHFTALVAGGTRAVFAFSPADAQAPPETARRNRWRPSKPDATPKPNDPKKAKEKTAREPTEQEGTPFREAAERWGFSFERVIRQRGEEVPQSAERAGELALEPSLPWRSELYFKPTDPQWKVLYAIKERPVLMERRFGAGSIVVAADAFFLSNEALRAEARATQLLAHLVGSPRRVVFDEEHLGIAEASGVATLARKYRLHGLVAGLGLLALLFLWQNIVRFVPPRDDDAAEDLIQGRGSSEGMLTLLRRSIPPSKLLATCLAEWKRTAPEDSHAAERLRRAYDEPAKSSSKPAEILEAYRTIARALHQRRRRTH